MKKWKVLVICMTCAFLFTACCTCPNPSTSYREQHDKDNCTRTQAEDTGFTLAPQEQAIYGSLSSESDIDFFRVDAPGNLEKMSLKVCYKENPGKQKQISLKPVKQNQFSLDIRVYKNEHEFKRFLFVAEHPEIEFYYNGITYLLIGVYGNPVCQVGDYELYFKSMPVKKTDEPTPPPVETLTPNPTIPVPGPTPESNSISLVYSIDIRLFIDQVAKNAASDTAKSAGKVVGWFMHTIMGKQVSNLIEALLDPLDKEFLFTKLDIYKVRYRSVAPDAKTDAILSGLLIVPAGRSFTGKMKIPILGYTHGTTLEKMKAPSCFTINEPFATFEVLVAMVYASMYGYIVAMPDYQGMGDDIGHVQPYMCKEPLSIAVADMLVFTKNFIEGSCSFAPCESCKDLDVAWNGQTYLAGYSQGGYVTMVTAQKLKEAKYNSLNLVAAASCAGPHSLDDTMRILMLRQENFPAAYFLPMTIRGFNSTYGDGYGKWFTKEKAFKPDYYEIWDITDGTQSADYVEKRIASIMKEELKNSNKNVPDKISVIPSNMLTEGMIEQISDKNSTVYKALMDNNSFYEKNSENKYIPWVIPETTSIRLFHSPQDDLVPYNNSVIASDLLKVPLMQVFFIPMDLEVHIEAAFSAFLSAYVWFNDIRSIHTELTSGDFLQPGHELRSENGNACLRYQLDGKLVLYDRENGYILWDAGYTLLPGEDPYLTVMRSDGKLAVYDLHGRVLWSSENTDAGSELKVTNEKKLLILDNNKKMVWSRP